MGCLAVLGAQGVRIPDDMSIGAFDNSEWLGIWRPPITAVDVAIEEISRLAVELLLRRIGVPVADTRRVRRQADHLYFEHIPDRPGIVPTSAGVLNGLAGRRDK